MAEPHGRAATVAQLFSPALAALPAASCERPSLSSTCAGFWQPLAGSPQSRSEAWVLLRPFKTLVTARRRQGLQRRAPAHREGRRGVGADPRRPRRAAGQVCVPSPGASIFETAHGSKYTCQRALAPRVAWAQTRCLTVRMQRCHTRGPAARASAALLTHVWAEPDADTSRRCGAPSSQPSP